MSLCPFSLLPPRKSRRKQPAKRRRREQPQHPIQVRRIRREQSEQRHACPERRSSKQRQRRHPSFPSQCHHRTAEGRKAGTRPYRLPYSHLIQSAAHRQIGRKRQQHQICTHRRRQAEHDRPHRQSLLLHSIAPPSQSFKRTYATGPHFISKPPKKVCKKAPAKQPALSRQDRIYLISGS